MNFLKHLYQHNQNSTYTNLIYECTFQLFTLFFVTSMLSAVYYICAGLQYEYFSAFFAMQQCVQFDWQTMYSDCAWHTSPGFGVKWHQSELDAQLVCQASSEIPANQLSSDQSSSCKSFGDCNAYRAVPTPYSMANESSIWSNLNTALLMCFVKWTLMTEVTIWFVQCSMQFLFYTILFLYTCTILFTFIAPGLLQSFRCYILLHLSWLYLISIVCADFIINYVIPVFAELQIEVVDSELMYITI